MTARLGTRAVRLHGTTVDTDDGGSVTGDAVVLATGAIARNLPGQSAGPARLARPPRGQPG